MGTDNPLLKEGPDLLTALRERLSLCLATDRKRYFGRVNTRWVRYAEEYCWDESQQDFRLHELLHHGFLPGECDILDVAAGCGQFLFRTLDAGYNCYGIEPAQWKIDFIREKNRALKRPAEWADRIRSAVGENLPFPDDSFDCVTSYQTLEHVQSPEKVIKEMIRVTRPGGGIYLSCPDYRGTFEAHYQLPWLPLFPRALARQYLHLLKRPHAGLDTLHYVTQPRIMKWINQIDQEKRCVITDENRSAFNNALNTRGLKHAAPLYPVYVFLKSIKILGRRELDVHLFIKVTRK